MDSQRCFNSHIYIYIYTRIIIDLILFFSEIKNKNGNRESIRFKIFVK